ncbi:AAA family ATPase [Roseovarius dicentrarchi]|uniref:AAA family ATPase n=1 Tax=Roseovarius dicentrarchi TaxID=2250573 RepID=UPI0019398E3A|nr:AAA family ATPase [Roseovarius dicentrarchi]
MLKRKNVFRAFDVKIHHEDLAQRIIERRLSRRVMQMESGPEVAAWLESAMAIWRIGHDENDVIGELCNRPDASDYPHYPRRISTAEQDHIKAWARSWCVRSTGAPLSSKIPKEDRAEIASASRSMRAQYLTEHQVDEAFSSIHRDYPWLERLTEKAWRQCLRRARAGLPAGVGPLLISGPPGLGKSSWSRAVARALGVPSVDVDVGTSGGITDLQGAARGWSSSDKGRVIRSMIVERVANPLVVLDEIDAGSTRIGTAGGGHLPGLYKIAMSMIEPSTAKSWVCPHLQIPFDLTNISWIATCNDYSHIDQPLLDRMTVIQLDDIKCDQLIDFAAREARRRFDGDVSEIVTNQVRNSMRRGARLSLRQVIRLLDRVQEAAERPILH